MFWSKIVLALHGTFDILSSWMSTVTCICTDDETRFPEFVEFILMTYDVTLLLEILWLSGLIPYTFAHDNHNGLEL